MINTGEEAEKTRSLRSRQDYEELLLELLRPLIPHFARCGARLELGASAAVYEKEAQWAEAFLRPLWGLVPLWAGGSRTGVFEEIYQKGLAAGTDPEGPQYWGDVHDVDQRFVEMAALSWGLLITPQVVWDPLGEQEKKNLAAWLDGINHYALPPCNWMFFAILVNVALKERGMHYHPEKLQEYLDYIESCYQGDGWYLDGQNGEKDYYVSFAFHYYSLIYVRFMEKEDPDRCLEYKNRARQFAEEFVYWFADQGEALAYGRSLTYRMAQASFFSMCVACGLEVLPFAVMKGIIGRHLRFWMRLPVFDSGGLLTIGYGYPNLLMSEQYNAPGSPYWALKVFALLALPEDDPFWRLEEALMPALAPRRLISRGKMLVQRINGQVYAYVAGRTIPHQHVHTEAKYSKFMYSSRFAFSVPRSMYSIEEAAPDNMLAVVKDGLVFVKGITETLSVSDQEIQMEWSPCPGVKVKTRLTLLDNGHRREHVISCDAPCLVYDCGAAIPDQRQIEERLREDRVEMLWGDQKEEGYQTAVISGEGKAVVIHASPNTNLLWPKTRIPSAVYELKAGVSRIETEFLVRLYG